MKLITHTIRTLTKKENISLNFKSNNTDNKPTVKQYLTFLIVIIFRKELNALNSSLIQL